MIVFLRERSLSAVRWDRNASEVTLSDGQPYHADVQVLPAKVLSISASEIRSFSNGYAYFTWRRLSIGAVIGSLSFGCGAPQGSTLKSREELNE